MMKVRKAERKVRKFCVHPDSGRRDRLSRLRRSSRSQRGQSIVELALLLPLFLVVILGIVETGRMWWTQQGLTSAAREGLRAATQSTGDCFSVFTLSKGRQSALDQLAATGLSNDQSNIAFVTLTPLTEDGASGQVRKIKITITYRYNSLLPFLPSLISGPATVSGDPALVTTAVAQCEP